jgi:hypothetical protein
MADHKSHKTSPGYDPLEGGKKKKEAPDTLVDGAKVVTAAPDDPPDDRRVPETANPPPARRPRGRPSEPPPPAKNPRGTPVVEIEVVHEHGPAPSTDRPFRTVEVWTRNRVYTLDALLCCVEVMDRATREVVADHPFLGMRLVGGQHREGERIELSHPFPRPGTEAVFEQAGPDSRAGAFSRTSAVTRVVLRLHIVTVMPNHVVPTWEEITGSILPPPIESE